MVSEFITTVCATVGCCGDVRNADNLNLAQAAAARGVEKRAASQSLPFFLVSRSHSEHVESSWLRAHIQLVIGAWAAWAGRTYKTTTRRTKRGRPSQSLAMTFIAKLHLSAPFLHASSPAFRNVRNTHFQLHRELYFRIFNVRRQYLKYFTDNVLACFVNFGCDNRPSSFCSLYDPQICIHLWHRKSAEGRVKSRSWIVV